MHAIKTAIVTGANGAIGKAIARQLAGLAFKVVLVCRDEMKADKAVKEIVQMTGNENVRYETVDLSLQQSIKDFANRWQGPLHVLINNAAASPRSRQETAGGIELQFATNVLGYFRMMQEFTAHLKNSAPSRVINVASYWAGDMELSDLEFKKRRYDNNSAYRQSKQANRMLTVVFAEQLKSYAVTVNSCHPGDVNSKLSNDLGFAGSASPDAGADTPVWLATEENVGQITGRYFEHRRETKCRFSADKNALEKLYQVCLQYSRST